MGFLDQEINFDMGHLILLALLAIVIFMNYKKEGMGGLPIVNPTYDQYMARVKESAKAGDLYGCDPRDTYAPYSPDECENQVQKAALFGCTPVV